MKFRLAALIGFFMISTFALTMWISTVKAQPIQELAYDDGGAEGSTTASAGIKHAVKFSLPSGWSEAKLLTARYNIYSDPVTFRVHVYGSDGITELASLDVTPTSTGWFDVDLSTLNIIVTGDFYISIEYLEEQKPWINIDTTAPDGQSYYGQPGAWTPFVNFDLMIRAVVQQPIPVGGVILKVDAFSMLAPYITILIALAAAVVSLKVACKNTIKTTPSSIFKIFWLKLLTKARRIFAQ